MKLFNPFLALALLCPFFSSSQIDCVQNISCSDNKTIETEGMLCGTSCTMNLTIPADAVDVMIEVLSKGPNSSNRAIVTPSGQSPIEIDLTDLPQIGSGHGTEAKVGRICVTGTDIQSSYDILFQDTAGTTLNGEHDITFFKVRQADPTVICGGSSATLQGGYVFHGEVTLPFSIPVTTTLDPKDIVVTIPLGDIDADGRLIVVSATAGGVTADTVFNNDMDPPYRLFNLFLNGVAGSVDQVDVTFCSPETGNNTISCSGNGDSFVIGSIVVNAPCDMSDCGPLAVELFDFKAKATKQKVDLQWASSLEINNSHYIIERSGDGNSNFSEIGRVVGKGTTNLAQHYDFTDNTISKEGNYYYRLKIVDKEGDYEFSETIALFIQMDRDFSILRSNPTRDVLELQNLDLVKNVQLTSLDGKVLISKNINQEQNQLSIPLENISTGLYLLRYKIGNQIEVERVIIN